MTANRFGLVYVQKRTLPEWLVWFVFLFPFFTPMLTEFIGLPGFVKYSVDLAYITAFLFIFFRRQTAVNKKLMPFVLFFIFFLLYTFVVYLFNFQSPFYYLWGVRNNFRFYILFVLFAVFFNEDEVQKCFKILDFLFWINMFVTLFQFFALNLHQDYLGGIFGASKGCNGYSIVFLIIITTKSLISFMNGVESGVKCFVKVGVALLIAAMAELKFFFIIFIVILILSSVLTEFSWRKFLLVFGSSLLIMLTAALLVTIFESFENFLSLENIWRVATQKNYASNNDMNRFSAVPTISERFLTSWVSRLFGMGLGNCDTSAVALFNTPFYDNYVDLHYSVFSVSFLFLETGYVGLITYFAFFVMCLIYSIKSLRKKTGNIFFNQMAIVIAIICFTLTFYNSSLRTEAGFWIYFVLALPFIETRKESNATVSE